jgi:hypothetical protein
MIEISEAFRQLAELITYAPLIAAMPCIGLLLIGAWQFIIYK